MPEHIRGHLQTLVSVFQSRKNHLLEQLPVPVVSVNGVAAHHSHGILGRQYHIAAAADDFPNVRILLVRHYAGACSELVREFDEPEIGTHIGYAV